MSRNLGAVPRLRVMHLAPWLPLGAIGQNKLKSVSGPKGPETCHAASFLPEAVDIIRVRADTSELAGLSQALAYPRTVNTGVNSKPKRKGSKMTTLAYMGAPAIDWLTLVTFNKDAADWARRTLHSDARVLGEELAVAKRMQYVGNASSFFFVGEADQGGKRHYLIQLWGARAHDHGSTLVREPDFGPLFKCTRMDVQWTNERPGPVDLPAMGERLREAPSNAWMFVGNRPRVDFYNNEDKKHTLYIGSRQSARMFRIYNKQFEDGLHVRVEVEYKSALAEIARDMYVSDPRQGLSRLLQSEWEALPKIATVYIPHLDSIADMSVERITVDYSQPELTATVNWVYHSVCPAIERLVKTEYAYEVVEALMEAMGAEGVRSEKKLKVRRSPPN